MKQPEQGLITVQSILFILKWKVFVCLKVCFSFVKIYLNNCFLKYSYLYKLGEELPNDQQVIMMAYRLRDSGLIFLEKKRSDIFRKVSLNVSPEDISYALDKYNI